MALYSWGRGKDHRLGHGDAADQSTPREVAALRGAAVTEVALGNCHGAALASEGEVYVWGGGMWQGGIGGGSQGPRRVGLGGGVPPCYQCSSVALGSWHGYLVLRRLP